MSLLPHLLNGITLGLLFALVALGFMLVVGVMEVINLAHGSLFALGAYFALTILGPGPVNGLVAGMDPIARYALAVVVGSLLAGIASLAIELCLRRTYGRSPLYGLLLTFGAAIVIEEAIRLGWGPSERFLPLPDVLNGAVRIGDLIYARYKLFAAGLSIVAIAGVWLFLERTPYGAIIKAGAHDSEMVRALGIDIARLRLLVFGFGASLAGFAGIVMVPIWGLRPHVGVDVVIPAFLVIVLGGVGSFWGAVLAALIVGLAVGLTGAYAAQWSLISMYILLIVVVTVRARGLFGRKSILEN